MNDIFYESPSLEKVIIILEYAIAGSVAVRPQGDITEEWTEEVINMNNDIIFRD